MNKHSVLIRPQKIRVRAHARERERETERQREYSESEIGDISTYTYKCICWNSHKSQK